MSAGQVAAVIDETLVSKGGQLIANALNQRASDPMEPSIIGLTRFEPADDPKGEEHQVIVGEHGGASDFPDGGPLPASGKSEKVDFKMPFSQRYAATIEVTRTKLAQLDLAEAYQQNKLLNFMANEFGLAFEDVYEKMESHALSNDPASGAANGFPGLNIIAQSDNVYGEIDATVYPKTGAIINTNGSARPLTLDLMRDQHKAMRNRGAKYDVILCSEEMLEAYTKLDGAAAENRGVGTVQQMMATDAPGIARHFSAGYVSASFKQRPLLPIPNFPTDAMDYARRGHFRGKVLSGWEIKKWEYEELIRWVIRFEANFFYFNRGKAYGRIEALQPA